MLWQIDSAHASVDFTVKHMAISTVRGSFKTFTAKGATNDDGFPTALSMEIDSASVTTNNEQRDAHLRSGDFFETEKFPKLTFKSTKITGTKDDLVVEGDMTIRGVTKPLTLRGELSQIVTDPWGNKRTSIALFGKLNRSDFGLTWNQALEFGGLMVSDEVKLSIEAEGTAVPVEETVGSAKA
jgi:polyisoprenoid-binding protein YceI